MVYHKGTKMGLNIKNEEVQRLARQISEETGETMTGAIHVALTERWNRLERQKNAGERLKQIRELVKSIGPIPEGVTSDHSDFYDEWGLPIDR